MKTIVGVVAGALVVGAVVVGLLVLRQASHLGGDGFTPPSDERVRQDVERFYARASGRERRPVGELRGCFSRHAGLWFYCEFDEPTVKAPTTITCVEVNVDEPCCSWEDGRWVVSDIARARAAAADGGSICG